MGGSAFFLLSLIVSTLTTATIALNILAALPATIIAYAAGRRYSHGTWSRDIYDRKPTLAAFAIMVWAIVTGVCYGLLIRYNLKLGDASVEESFARVVAAVSILLHDQAGHFHKFSRAADRVDHP